MNWKTAKENWLSLLSNKMDKQEALSNLHILAEEALPYSKIEIKLNDFILSTKEIHFFENAISQLVKGKPIQYIIQKAWFRNFELFVNNKVLIPRPETEELISLIIQNNTKVNPTILDIGTGSGCIAIALKKELPKATIWAVDVSPKAIEVAQKNALNLKTQINFKKIDILNKKQWHKLPKFDIIVSNPPYIPNKEKIIMANNVLNYEPHLALFVENDEPLIFYKTIVNFALQHLNQSGKLYFECNEYNAKEVQQLLIKKAFVKPEIYKDLQEKDRMIMAEKT